MIICFEINSAMTGFNSDLSLTSVMKELWWWRVERTEGVGLCTERGNPVLCREYIRLQGKIQIILS